MLMVSAELDEASNPAWDRPFISLLGFRRRHR